MRVLSSFLVFAYTEIAPHQFFCQITFKIKKLQYSGYFRNHRKYFDSEKCSTEDA